MQVNQAFENDGKIFYSIFYLIPLKDDAEIIYAHNKS